MEKSDHEIVSEGLTYLTIIKLASCYGYKNVLCVRYDNKKQMYILTLPNRLHFAIAKEWVDAWKEKMFRF